MIRNYYVTALRNLRKHKSYFILNMSGLAIGIASFIFIALLVINELSYDRYHINTENTYRVQVKGQMMGQDLDMAVTASPMAQALLDDYPEVEKVTRIKESGAWIIGYKNRKFNEGGVLFADTMFFNVFKHDFIEGDPSTALIKPRSMVLTESFAAKYFGSEDPMGKFLTVEQDTNLYEVTAVIKDTPKNSHIQFDMLGSRSSYPNWDNNMWVSHNDYTYIVLNNNADQIAFEEKMQDIVVKYVGPQISKFLGTTMEAWEQAGNSFGYYLMPIADIHLHSNVENELEANSDISYIYIYSLIAFILLFIAIINFVNLATAQSSSRSKEVGVRKVLGSNKGRLIYQFIFESVIISFIATVIAVVIISLLTPGFENLVGKELAIHFFSNPMALVALAGLAILIGILSGFYPAFILAGFQPAEVLKGRMKAGAKSGWLRNLLVVVQFAASIVIIVGTVIVYSQIDFMLSKNLGFDKEQILVVRRPDVLKDHLETFKTELLKNPSITGVANATSIPGKDNYWNNAHFIETNPESPYILMESRVSFGYGEVMGLELVEGRFHSREYPSDSLAVVINEAAVKLFGLEDPLGKHFLNKDDDGSVEKMPIIGIVRDYNIHSLHRKIEPTLHRIMPGNWEGYMVIKLNNTQNVREIVSHIEEMWYKYSSNKPFQYFFFDEDYASLYESETTTGQVFIVFAGLSIFIACLGLIGLITYTTTVRRKEIGIRKVMGAGTGSLVRLLSSEFVKLLVIATVISWPLAYFAVNYWLRNFADRVFVNPVFFLLATLIVYAVGSLAISYQTIKASMSNPVDSLRQE